MSMECQIGDCPKCEKRTFVVYTYVKSFGKIAAKGQCYNCGNLVDLEFK